MKRIITILTCLLFLVALVPGAVLQQVIDPVVISESGTSNEPVNNTEERTEEHFISFRNKLQQEQQPVAIQHRHPINQPPYYAREKASADAVAQRPVHTSGTPLYLQYNSWLI